MATRQKAEPEKRVFEVEAIERFRVRTTYRVTATTAAEAEALCRSGDVAYESCSIEEGDDEWVETLSIDPQTP